MPNNIEKTNTPLLMDFPLKNTFGEQISRKKEITLSGTSGIVNSHRMSSNKDLWNNKQCQWYIIICAATIQQIAILLIYKLGVLVVNEIVLNVFFFIYLIEAHRILEWMSRNINSWVLFIVFLFEFFFSTSFSSLIQYFLNVR